MKTILFHRPRIRQKAYALLSSAVFLAVFVFASTVHAQDTQYPSDITLTYGETRVVIPDFVSYEVHDDENVYYTISRDVTPNPTSVKRFDYLGNAFAAEAGSGSSARVWQNEREESSETVFKQIHDIAFTGTQRYGSVTEYEITETRRENGQSTESVLGTITVTVPPTVMHIQVLDSENGEPVESAQIQFRPVHAAANVQVQADSDGTVTVYNCFYGSNTTFLVTAPGYKSTQLSLLATGDNSYIVRLERDRPDYRIDISNLPPLSATAKGVTVTVPKTNFSAEKDISVLDGTELKFAFPDMPSVTLTYEGDDKYSAAVSNEFEGGKLGFFEGKIGYNIKAEGIFNRENIAFELTQGTANANMEASARHDIPTGIPFINLSLTGEGKISPTLTLTPNISSTGRYEYLTNGSLDSSMSLSVAPKIGIEMLASAEAGGNAVITAKSDDMSRIEDTLSIDGTLSVYARFQALSGTWEEVMSYTIAEHNFYPGTAETEKVQATVETILAPRDYINNPSSFDPAPNTSPGSQGTPLKQNVYPQSRPTMGSVTSGTSQTIVVAWLDDDPERNSANRSKLVYSVSRDGGVTFDEPKELWEDGTLDCSPRITVDGDDIYIIWQNYELSIPDDMEPGEAFSHAGIAAAKFDGEKFIPISGNNYMLTEPNGVLEIQPVIGAHNGKLLISWAENAQNNPLMEGQNTLRTTEYNGGEETGSRTSYATNAGIIAMNYSGNDIYSTVFGYGNSSHIISWGGENYTVSERGISHSSNRIESSLLPDGLNTKVTGCGDNVLLYWIERNDDNTGRLEGILYNNVTGNSEDIILSDNGTILNNASASLAPDGTITAVYTEKHPDVDSTDIRVISVKTELPEQPSCSDYFTISEYDGYDFGVTVTGNVIGSYDMTLYCAFYDGSGNFMGIDSHDLSNVVFSNSGSRSFGFDSIPEGAEHAKVFIFDNDTQIPYAKPYEKNLTFAL